MIQGNKVSSMRAAYYISLGYRVNHKAGLYAGEIRQINNVSLLSVHRIQNLQPLYYKAQRSAIKDKKMKRAPLITGLLLISTSCAYASSGGCGADSTSGATNYSSVVDDVTVNQTDNVTGREFTSATLSSTNWQYACSCSAGKAVKLVYMVSPVLTTTGHQTGYYKLNDSLDIKTTLQANDIPGLTTDQVVSVNTRFTQIKNNTVYSAATQTGVCQGDTSRYGPVNIGANTTFTLYVTKPFLGSMTIPKTDIAVIKGAWVDGMGSPSTGDFHDLVKLSIQGNLTAPQSCKINQGDVIKVNFGFINGQKFTTRNAMPDGFTPVDFDITYDCGDTSKIKNSLQMRIDGTTGVVDQYNLVARRRSSDNVPDVGIRIENLGGGVANIPFQNGILPVDPSGHGTVNMRAWPVNLVGGELETGKFQGTATITVIVR
ncbi:putative fimbrial protein [Escherichia coli B175]|nr:putative fimbrial protein [Escherichia coli B175]